jgi:hypothetical protein
LKGREYEDAGEIVVIPGEFLFGEITNRFVVIYEEKKSESFNVVE